MSCTFQWLQQKYLSLTFLFLRRLHQFYPATYQSHSKINQFIRSANNFSNSHNDKILRLLILRWSRLSKPNSGKTLSYNLHNSFLPQRDVEPTTSASRWKILTKRPFVVYPGSPNWLDLVAFKEETQSHLVLAHYISRKRYC
jgi:hypothetical protein